jgi:hypothetical protein
MEMPGKWKDIPSTKEYMLVYCELIQAARRRGTLTYQRMSEVMGIPAYGGVLPPQGGKMLSAISEAEVAHGRPMLSVICLGLEGHPGESFYSLARKLGRLTTAWPDEDSFFKSETEAVYDAWKLT